MYQTLNAGIHDYEKALGTETTDELPEQETTEQSTASGQREYIAVDSFVHAFCKLFGHIGTPEYGQGLTFRDYITNELKKPNTSTRTTYLQNVLETNLERQVGSRYFVTVYNSAKIHFLRPAALEFLKYLEKVKNLNRLEQYVLSKVQDTVTMTNVQIDGLFFYHIYADLTTLVKSTQLNKSVLDMNTHYLELLNFLQELQLHQERLFDRSTPVFTSEPRLHTSRKLNHRHKHKFIYDKLFINETEHVDIITPRVKAAADSMTSKLKDYKKDQLPGGKHWEPTDDIKDILRQLQPNNDICESILGLNDWLSNQMPNLCQKTKSTLVEVKKNKTMTWLQNLPDERRTDIIDLAQKKRRSVEFTVRQEEETIRDQRIKKLEAEKKKAQDKEVRRQAEKDKLSTITVIETVESLHQEIKTIDDDKTGTIPGKAKKKMELVKNQVRVRNKLLGRQTKITFSTGGIQKPYEDLLQEVEVMIQREEDQRKRPSTTTPPTQPKRSKQSAVDYLTKPTELVGKDIVHRFVNDDEEEQLWAGKITSYNHATEKHTLTYTGDTEQYTYNLTSDITNGDLWVIT